MGSHVTKACKVINIHKPGQEASAQENAQQYPGWFFRALFSHTNSSAACGCSRMKCFSLRWMTKKINKKIKKKIMESGNERSNTKNKESACAFLIVF